MDRDTAIQFLTSKVAKIIYDTVSCDLADRAEVDWKSASVIVREKFKNVLPLLLIPGVKFTTDPVFKEQRELPENCSYEQFDQVVGFLVWTHTQPLRRLLPSPPYGRITFY